MSHHAPELPYCRNCHYTLATPRPAYCGHCGQETDLHPPSVREMFTEYLGHYVAFDGPLWRTLWALVCLPGHLTTAYFHGQRRRYVLPLRVYLSMSFLFFVGSHLLSHEDAADAPEKGVQAEQPAVAGKPVTLRVKPNATPAETAAAAASAAGLPPESATGTQQNSCDSAPPGKCGSTQRWLGRLVGKGQSMTREQWTTRARALAPYGMLAMQPIFAALLLAMFAGSGRRYAEHFVFSLHSHSLWFLALLLLQVTELEGTIMSAVFLHGLVAMRRVYGLGWWGAVWRGVLVSTGYFVLLIAALVAFAALIAMTS
ncbi:DUF3667 domain-containing protein [Roseateles saccharophilus]|uniref:Uncharacterized protein DUF3667 n=1 Tax=Roseateles saccharophilus TaxID=304 RepID=A0A4R3VK35_ROSSA|nr:DUF3667 domain-containing protein [Roseateles saccharophilus]MDG0835964.1 DUF3667 domain-containing protein [Roseateles saccharophilus]TCV03395.1 uncharacterized protein DUF3667 [Roseateles saccharophilus]